jgi:peptidoglycan hydrolase CwlO-like protein
MKKAILALLLITAMLTGTVPQRAFAQRNEADIAAEEAKLRSEYDALQKDIEKWQVILNDTRKKASGIQGDISGLNAKIREAELTIRQKNIAIQQLSREIGSRTQKIGELEGRIEKGRESIAQLIRRGNELDSYSVVEVLLANQNVSDFFQDVDEFFSIKRALREHFMEIREAKAATEAERAALDQKKEQEADARYVVQSRQKTIEANKKEKDQLLAITKQEEKAYQDVLAERQSRAAAIRAALFRLRDTDGISFSEALTYANAASAKTGVRAALILAILKQESDLGRNQGSCLVTDLASGDGAGKNTGSPFERVMAAPRDTVPFEAITTRLGRSWSTQPVSCPPSATWRAGRGFGGAMGPSQFIPSTWEIIKTQIAPLLDISPDEANPWNPQHSFMATAVYLANRGAAAGGFSAERNAACRYYSGAACQPGRKPANVFYGDEVMQKAEEIQTNIDFLKGI